MAEHKINGTDVLLFISTDNITFNTVVCLTANSITRLTNEIDAKSKCGPDKLPGTQDNGVAFEGQVMADPSTGRISLDELEDYWNTKRIIYWKMGKAVPILGDITWYGTAFISKLDENYAQDEVGIFSGALGVQGLINKTTATS